MVFFYPHHGINRFVPPPLPRAAFLLSGLALQCFTSRALADDFLASGSRTGARDSLDLVRCFSAITGIAATRSRCCDSRAATPLFRLWFVSGLVDRTLFFLSTLLMARGDADRGATGPGFEIDKTRFPLRVFPLRGALALTAL